MIKINLLKPKWFGRYLFSNKFRIGEKTYFVKYFRYIGKIDIIEIEDITKEIAYFDFYTHPE